MKSFSFLVSLMIVFFFTLVSASPELREAVFKIDKAYYRAGFSLIVFEGGVWRIDSSDSLLRALSPAASSSFERRIYGTPSK